jgi:molybdopterin-guanine dinucleotide biosynthesis protein A
MLIGIFVGGRGTRMGGAVKGLLPAPDTGEPLIKRLSRIALEAIPGGRVVLVGDAEPFAAFGFPVLDDDPPRVGPLGGLAALLREGQGDSGNVIALAADLPRVTTTLVIRLATHAPAKLAVAPRLEGIWNPLFARYSGSCAPLALDLLKEGRRSLKSLLEALGTGAEPLPVSPDEKAALDDWDSPEDMARK